MTTTKIQWTDETWNPVRGCDEISPGCAHCYAKTFAERWRGVKGHPYEQGFDVRLVPEKLDEPLRWKRPRMVFVNSMSDLFHDEVPDDFLNSVFSTMERSPQHTFQVLTKRADRLAQYVNWRWGKREEGPGYRIPSKNVWLGVSVEDQKRADERIPFLLNTPAAIRFLSCEPLLGPIFLDSLAWPPTFMERSEEHRFMGIDWVIVGGESGPGARPCNIEWIRGIVRQCKAAGVPCFVKQLGSHPIVPHPEDPELTRVQKRFVLEDKKGGNPSEWPADLRVREFPK